MATHADRQQALDAATRQLLQHLQIGGKGGLVYPGLQYLLGRAGQAGYGSETILGALTNTKHSVHQAGFKGTNADLGDDAGPLGTFYWLTQAGGQHALLHPEIQLVLPVQIPAAAVGRNFHGFKALLQKGAGLAHIGHPAGIAEPAIAA